MIGISSPGNLILWEVKLFCSSCLSMCQAIPEDVVKSLLASGEFDVANKEVNNIIADGYPVSQLISQVISI